MTAYQIPISNVNSNIPNVMTLVMTMLRANNGKPFGLSLLADRLAVPYALIRLCQTVRCAMVAPCGGSIIPNPLTLVPAA